MALCELLPAEMRIHLETANMDGIFVYVDRETQNALKGVGKVNIKITYPLKNPAYKEIDLTDLQKYGDAAYVIQSVIDFYRQIYFEEEKSMTTNISDRGNLINRPSSNGKYGIWGHDLGDLMLWGVEVNTETNEITVGVDS